MNVVNKVNDKSLVETLKFVVRLALLVFTPQLLALATDNEGMVWADLLSVALPVLDKWVHETDKTKLTGLIPF